MKLENDMLKEALLDSIKDAPTGFLEEMAKELDELQDGIHGEIAGALRINKGGLRAALRPIGGLLVADALTGAADKFYTKLYAHVDDEDADADFRMHVSVSLLVMATAIAGSAAGLVVKNKHHVLAALNLAEEQGNTEGFLAGLETVKEADRLHERHKGRVEKAFELDDEMKELHQG